MDSIVPEVGPLLIEIFVDFNKSWQPFIRKNIFFSNFSKINIQFIHR